MKISITPRAITFYVGAILSFIFTMFPFALRIKKVVVPFDYSTVPFIVTLIFCLSTVIPIDVIVRGLLGPAAPADYQADTQSHLIPITVIVQFMSLAYVCQSAQQSQLFDIIAEKLKIMAIKSKESVLAGYCLFFLFCLFITLLTSNDMVILCLTPILLDFLQKLNVFECQEVLLLSVFAFANIFSMSLLTSNGSNYIISQIIDLDYLSYLMKMLPLGLICGTVVFLSCLGFMYQAKKSNQYQIIAIEEDEITTNLLHEIQIDDLEDLSVLSPFNNTLYKFNLIFSSIVLGSMFVMFVCSYFFSELKGFQLCYITVSAALLQLMKDIYINATQTDFSIWVIIQNLPWKIPLFLLSMFVLVENACATNVIVYISQQLLLFLHDKTDYVNAVIVSLLMLAICFLCNNLPGTIIISRILLVPQDSAKQFKDITYYAAAMMSNVSALFLPHCSLAGLMWMGLVRKSKKEVRQLRMWLMLIFHLIIVFLIGTALVLVI